MAEKSRILMIDDHALILEGYKSKLRDSFNPDELSLLIDTAHDCDEASEKIQSSLHNQPYDIIFLDINLPPSKDKAFLSGEDLGKEIRKVSPSTSLIVFTMHSDNLRLISILKNLDPEAFLIKSDVNSQEFLKAFNKVRGGNVYYSQSITNMIRKQLSSNIVLDRNDRAILFHLAEGVRTKDLVDIVPLSLAAIEKRKKVLKELFEVENMSDLALIRQARKIGFL